MQFDPHLVLSELSRRSPRRFELTDYCFKEQLDFILDPAQYKTAVCSRRAGKTIACAADLIHTALNYPDVICLYITLRRTNAAKLIWPELLKINRAFNLGGEPNGTILSLTFKNGSVIYCSGAKDKSEIEHFRGLAIKKVYVDECQSFRPYIQELIDDVLSKALFDYAGTLCLIGTPGLIEAGYFYECAHSDHWKNHAWTMFENPHIEKKSGKSVLELVDQDCKRMGVSRDHPKIQRECYGKWATDADSLVFKYSKEVNGYEAIPELIGKWEYVIGVDVGFDDSDALAVIGWHPKLKECYLIEEIVQDKQGITELADQIDKLVTKYDPLKVVMDTGGLGKKIAVELQKRRSLPIEAAEKSRKIEFIEILNDALRTKKFFAKPGSRFAEDCGLVEWDRDKITPDRKVISEAYHSDIADAVLYAFREALHWLYEPERITPKAGSPEAFAEQEREMEEQVIAALNSQNEEDIWADYR